MNDIKKTDERTERTFQEQRKHHIRCNNGQVSNMA